VLSPAGIFAVITLFVVGFLMSRQVDLRHLMAAGLLTLAVGNYWMSQLKLSIGRMRKELFSQYANAPRVSESAAAGHAVANIAEGSPQEELNLQQGMISQIARVQPAGRVVLGIRPDARTAADIPDFPLEDGDSFYVPPRLGTVQVVGEVYNENAFRYQPGRSLEAYLKDSGGATRLADVKRAFLIRADGTVESRQSHSQHWPSSFEKVTLMPGDAIVVPPKLKAPGGLLEELPWMTQILSQTAMTGAVLSLIH